MSKYCSNCGKELNENADICLSCGKNTASTKVNVVKSNPKWKVELLIWFIYVIVLNFIGMIINIGIHFQFIDFFSAVSFYDWLYIFFAIISLFTALSYLLLLLTKSKIFFFIVVALPIILNIVSIIGTRSLAFVSIGTFTIPLATYLLLRNQWEILK